MGKTMQAITFMAYTKSMKLGPSLVLAPLSVLDHWRREIHKVNFSAQVHQSVACTSNHTHLPPIRSRLKPPPLTTKVCPHMHAVVYAGSKEGRSSTRASIESAGAPDVLVCSFDTALRDTAYLARTQWYALVVDEAQRLKNADAVLYAKLQTDIAFRMPVRTEPAPLTCRCC